MAAADNRPEIKIELPKRKEIKKSKKIALCAVFSALGVVLLYMGALIEVLDLSAAARASGLAFATAIPQPAARSISTSLL